MRLDGKVSELHPFMAGKDAMSDKHEPQIIVDCKDAAESAGLSYASTDDPGLLICS
jgi:hypothetical protein